jgi:hypothetical protein
MMQFPRYEQVVPRADRPEFRYPPPGRPTRPRPRPLRFAARVLRQLAQRWQPAGRIDPQEYLRLEFTVDDRR